MKQCPNCGEQAQEGWILCPSCGIDMRKAADRLGRDHYIPPRSEPEFIYQSSPPHQEIVTEPRSTEVTLQPGVTEPPTSKGILSRLMWWILGMNPTDDLNEIKRREKEIYKDWIWLGPLISGTCLLWIIEWPGHSTIFTIVAAFGLSMMITGLRKSR